MTGKADLVDLPETGSLTEEREEWAVWWHGNSPAGIVMDERHLPSRAAALNLGPSKFGQWGIRGFTTVRRLHRLYENGDWSGLWERVGDTVWQQEGEKT